MPAALAPRLREALARADYTVDAVDDLLGETARAALERNETTPALRRTTGGSPLATLTRLFLLQTPVAGTDAERALPGLVDALATAGSARPSAGEVRARLDCRPYADDAQAWWVVSDLTPGLDGQPIRVDADHVLGVSPASTSLAQLASARSPARSTSAPAAASSPSTCPATPRDVVATDVNPRALAITAFNAALNEIDGSTSATGRSGSRSPTRRST